MKKIWQAIAVLGLGLALPAAAQYQGQMMMQGGYPQQQYMQQQYPMQQQYMMPQQQQMMAPQAGQYPQQYQQQQPQQQLGEQRPPVIMANDNVKVTCPGSDYRYNSTSIKGSASSSSSKDNDH